MAIRQNGTNNGMGFGANPADMCFFSYSYYYHFTFSVTDSVHGPEYGSEELNYGINVII